MIQVRAFSRQKVIYDDDRIAFAEQRIAQMRAQKSGSASYQGPLAGHDFLIFLEAVGHCTGWRDCGGSRGTADAVVSETARRHGVGIIEIAAVDHDRVSQFLENTVQIERGKFLPLGQDQQCVGAACRFVWVSDKLRAGIQNFPGALRLPLDRKPQSGSPPAKAPAPAEWRAIRGCRRCHP